MRRLWLIQELIWCTPGCHSDVQETESSVVPIHNLPRGRLGLADKCFAIKHQTRTSRSFRRCRSSSSSSLSFSSAGGCACVRVPACAQRFVHFNPFLVHHIHIQPQGFTLGPILRSRGLELIFSSGSSSFATTTSQLPPPSRVRRPSASPLPQSAYIYSLEEAGKRSSVHTAILSSNRPSRFPLLLPTDPPSAAPLLSS